jgi:hypothetical protein
LNDIIFACKNTEKKWIFQIIAKENQQFWGKRVFLLTFAADFPKQEPKKGAWKRLFWA